MNRNFGRTNNYPTLWRSVRHNRKERIIFIVTAGIVFSLFLTLVFVVNFRSDAIAKEAPNQRVDNPGSVTLLTPERPVKPGEALSSVRFRELYWPRNQVPEGAVRDVAEVQGMYAKVPLSPQVPLQINHMTRETAQVTLPVTQGNRAVTIEIDETSGIEGHALPGTKVDVTLTYYENGALTSKIIVQNARIISAGGDTTTIGQGSKPLPTQRKASRTVTLDVPVKDALEIQTARQLGRLSLFMRALDDDKGASVTDVSQHDLEGNKGAKAGPKKPNCRMGRMKSNGKEFIVDCDGSISEVLNPSQP